MRQVKEQLREAIAAEGVSIYALAARLGWHHQALYRMLSPDRGMKLERAEEIARELGYELTLVDAT